MSKIIEKLKPSAAYILNLQGDFNLEIAETLDNVDFVEVSYFGDELVDVDININVGEISIIDKRSSDFSGLGSGFSNLKDSIGKNKGFVSSLLAFISDVSKAKESLSGVKNRINLKVMLSKSIDGREIDIDSLNMKVVFDECNLKRLGVKSGNLKFEGGELHSNMIQVKSGNLKAYFNKKLDDVIKVDALNCKIYMSENSLFKNGVSISGNNVKIIGDYRQSSKDIADLVVSSKNAKLYFDCDLTDSDF